MRTLLLADDGVTTQRVVVLIFAEQSFRVITVSDGQQALEAMAAMRPDIVLASTMLPLTDGYDLSVRMRGIEALRQVPVLLLSGAFESVDAARLEASGARGIIEKPLEPTVVISRVRELLGLKDARPAAPAGRLVTSADTTPDKKAPPRPAAVPPAASKPAVATWDELRKETGLEPDARSVEGGTAGSGREDYLGTLDAAFDSLDQHLAGRHDAQAPQRNPSGPLGHASGAADPRSPGRRPSMTTEGQSPNAVFEVDADWFSNEDRDRDRASSRGITADAHEAMPRSPDVEPAKPVFEVDDEWFAADEQARGERLMQHRELAAEMGIHDVELPAVAPGLTPAPADGLDFDFGLDEMVGDAPAASPDAAAVSTAPEVQEVAPVQAVAPTNAPVITAETPAEPEPAAPPAVEPVNATSSVTPSPGSVADDFAALLAFETGDGPAPVPPEPAIPVPTVQVAPVAPVVIQAPAPEITDAMLDQIAERVVERLNTSTFSADLRDLMTATVRDTVRSVVSETSERLVRDEIARIKGRVELDTQ